MWLFGLHVKCLASFTFLRTQVITFIDLAGHEKYLKTTVFGMTGHAPDFAMLMVNNFNDFRINSSV